jgi:hypothetical protein
MTYSPATDFLALIRQTAAGVEVTQMPGLDYVVAALARAGLFQLSVGQAPPTANQSTTVWLKPSIPSWVAEGAVFLWNAGAGQYQPATPALWSALLAGAGATNGYAFQSVSAASAAIVAGTTLLAVQRAAPSATALLLPALAAQRLSGGPLRIVDWSTTVAAHTITITTPDGSTIMRQPSWQLLSTAVQLAGVLLYPSPDLNGWVIAP